MTAKPKGLVGRCFVIWAEPPQYACPVPNLQGTIIAQLEDSHYLVQFFDALLGQPSTLAIFHITRMVDRGRRQEGSFTLFEDLEHLNHWQETWGRHC